VTKQVVLVHGIFSTAYTTSLRKLVGPLRQRGFKVSFISYVTGPQDFMTNQVRKKLKKFKGEYWYIGHSMGGIIGTYLRTPMLITINSPTVDGYGYDIKSNDYFQKIFSARGDVSIDSESHAVDDAAVREVMRYIGYP